MTNIPKTIAEASSPQSRPKIVVVDVPAVSGGNLTILRELHSWAVEHDEFSWVFMVSTPSLSEHEHVRVHRFPWVKRSWLHRLAFDVFRCRWVISKSGADAVISLQNTVIPGVRLRQLVYVHQPLPFTDQRWGLIASPRMWVYQNVIGRLIKRSIRVADAIVVQTRWMEQAIQEMLPREAHKVVVVPPTVDLSKHLFGEIAEGVTRTFFYPASAAPYKNHATLIKAMRILREQGLDDFRVDLTITREELVKLGSSQQIPDNMNARGPIPYGEVLDIYRGSTLVFPSTLETFGLPLLEARMLRRPIIAADEPYAREVLWGYRYCSFFPALDARGLAEALVRAASGQLDPEVEDPRTEDADLSRLASGSWDLVVQTLMSTRCNSTDNPQGRPPGVHNSQRGRA